MPSDSGGPQSFKRERPASLFGGVMLRISLAYFYDLSRTIDRLRNVRPGMKLNDAWLDLYEVEQAIDRLVSSPTFNQTIRTSWGAAQNLLGTLRSLTTKPYDESDASILSQFQLAGIMRLLADFETILRAEFAAADAYYVTPKRGFDTLSLVTQGEVLWPPALYQKVPETLADVREAGKCIAFELGTAAGFHIIRTLEAVLLRYWKAVTNGKPVPANKNLGNYLNQLEKLGAGDAKIIAALRQIKDLHRNELFHPEVSLTIQEAIELLGIVQSAVGAMLNALPDLKPADAPVPPVDPALVIAEPAPETPEANASASSEPQSSP